MFQYFLKMNTFIAQELFYVMPKYITTIVSQNKWNGIKRLYKCTPHNKCTINKMFYNIYTLFTNLYVNLRLHYPQVLFLFNIYLFVVYFLLSIKTDFLKSTSQHGIEKINSVLKSIYSFQSHSSKNY